MKQTATKSYRASDLIAYGRQEIIAGLCTFFTMSYSVFTIPMLLSAIGMDKGHVLTAMCLGSFIGCVLIGLWAQVPFAIGTSIGIGLYISIECLHQQIPWQEAWSIALAAQLIFLLLSYCNIRQWLGAHIPDILKAATTAGIALLIAIVAFKLSECLTWQTSQTAFWQYQLHRHACIGFGLGLIMMIGLTRYRQHDAFIIMLLASTLLEHTFAHQWPHHLIQIPHHIDLNLFAFQYPHSLPWSSTLAFLLAILLINLLDCSATLYSLADTAGMLKKPGIEKQMNRGLIATGLTNLCSLFMGSAPNNLYFESAAGIHSGGRGGLTAITCGVLFLCTICMTPVIHMVPHYAIAAGLFYTSLLVAYEKIEQIQWKQWQQGLTAFVATAMIPLSHSIPTGIGLGLMCHHWLTRKQPHHRATKRTRWLLNFIFGLYFVLQYGH